ncbi:MAG: FtsQ-type POTRA domain-containing protein [Candidatus Planktophila sp.]|nr:FtsQ-type POTRA domain-containing protein [Candidatus Planktophila sp.]
MKKHRLFIALAVLIFVIAAYILGWSTFFTVSSVEIKGTNALMSSTIVPGQKLARVEPRTVAAEFEKSAWIKSADVSRNWISGKVTITLTERSPVAIYNDQAIDADGVSFPAPTDSVADLPQITAPSIESAVAASAFLMGLPAEIADMVQLVKVRSGDAYLLQIYDGKKSIEILWGQEGETALKVKVYKALIAQPENSGIRHIDLTAPHAPIVK